MTKKICVALMLIIFSFSAMACSYYDDPVGDKVQEENQELLEELEDEYE